MRDAFQKNPLDPNHRVSLNHCDDPHLVSMESDAVVDCGWGRLMFG
ncbi:MAG: hypothetical protein V4525_16180 [Pseudomonadota bacterium]